MINHHFFHNVQHHRGENADIRGQILVLQSCLSIRTVTTELIALLLLILLQLLQLILLSVLNYKQNVWQCHSGDIRDCNMTGRESWVCENMQ